VFREISHESVRRFRFHGEVVIIDYKKGIVRPVREISCEDMSKGRDLEALTVKATYLSAKARAGTRHDCFDDAG